MQRTAQDWLVLTELTHHNASAVGMVMALQFGPQLLLLPWTGFAADHFNQRKLLIATQATMGVLALALGILTVAGVSSQLWHVYVFAFLFGCAAAFDAPVRQTFVAELVGDADLPNAVALNSTSFNAARMIGPAVAGVVIAAVGTGWAFLINGASFARGADLPVAAARLRASSERARCAAPRAASPKGCATSGARPDLRAILVMLFLIGTFGLNFPIFISTMAVERLPRRRARIWAAVVDHGDRHGRRARCSRPAAASHGFGSLLVGAAVFGLGCTLAALAPGLLVVRRRAGRHRRGRADLHQRDQQPDAAFDRAAMRGRVMALRVGIALGGTPIGAPIVGWVADHFGPRWALGVGAASGFAAAVLAIQFLVARSRRTQARPPADPPFG